MYSKTATSCNRQRKYRGNLNMNDFDKAYKQQLEEVWGKVGFIVNLSQMIEYNLANILAFNEILREFDNKDSMYLLEYNTFAVKANDLYDQLSKHTFGYGLKRAKEIKFFTDDSLERLQTLCKERNFVVHHLFIDDLKQKHLETDPNFYFERLEHLINDMYSANEELTKIFKQQKDQFQLIW